MSEDQVKEQQPAEVVKMDKTERKRSAVQDKAPAQTAASQQKMFLISEQAVNQLLNTIAELQGLTWKQTNPIIVFIQQSLTPHNGQ